MGSVLGLESTPLTENSTFHNQESSSIAFSMGIKAQSIHCFGNLTDCIVLTVVLTGTMVLILLLGLTVNSDVSLWIINLVHLSQSNQYTYGITSHRGSPSHPYKSFSFCQSFHSISSGRLLAIGNVSLNQLVSKMPHTLLYLLQYCS